MTLLAAPPGARLHLRRPQTLPTFICESRLTSFELRLTVPRVLLQALLLVDDDVLDVFHRQVVAKGVKENVFQLLQGDSLHVELRGDTDERSFPTL